MGNPQTATLTTLLKHFSINLSAVQANQRLIASGILEERLRRSSRNPERTKKFKALTATGKQFGTNQPNPVNPEETAPRYYYTAFPTLARCFLLPSEAEQEAG